MVKLEAENVMKAKARGVMVVQVIIVVRNWLGDL
jgi:hypothetical protein